jgi:hypothetical protein
MIKYSLRELTHGAQVILTAKVSDIHCEWSLDRQLIMTIVTLDVEEILKGIAERHVITIQIHGGEIDGLGLRVSDMPVYSKGERVLVFLNPILDRKNPGNSPSVIQGLLPAHENFARAQGKFSIDSKGNAKREGYRLVENGANLEGSLFLDDMKARIEMYLEEIKDRRGKIHEKRKS